jgi:LPXTG-motif cell wall-anchored protein
MVYLKSIVEFPANTTMNTATASAYDEGHGVSALASAKSGPLQGRVCGSIDIVYILAIIAIALLLIIFLIRRKKRNEGAQEGA